MDAQELLFAMSLAAQDEARQRLSEEGQDFLDMINLVSRTSKISVVDAWVEARATATLSEREKDVLTAYVARMSLIEAKLSIPKSWPRTSSREEDGLSEIPDNVWAIGKARPLGEPVKGVYHDTPIRVSEREGLAPLTILDPDGERALPVFTTRYKAERGILHFMSEEERADGPIASVFISLEDLIKTFRGRQPEGVPEVDYIGVDMGEGGVYSLVRL
jgi:hypothetical protein